MRAGPRAESPGQLCGPGPPLVHRVRTKGDKNTNTFFGSLPARLPIQRREVKWARFGTLSLIEAMQTYDYRCESNGQVYEVSHPMSMTITKWGELCEVGRFDRGDIAAEEPVTRLLKTGGIVKKSALRNPEAPPCMSGGGCSGGRCGI